jgi:hypothetical protein
MDFVMKYQYDHVCTYKLSLGYLRPLACTCDVRIQVVLAAGVVVSSTTTIYVVLLTTKIHVCPPFHTLC